ncbi:lysophospholipid acyltransferase family protein [Methylobacter sp.]|uniref:lysophospholipid acyltransferase family protein n=1 Tax=Methylobacter sp. TaxID=2051955 RepID=UPI0012262B75|nr:lysophospholipid acyltransferase family protein [Methylobacter sp.]TAK63390.1 MAG: 1-acyl-sn-glycerol-3-phosphate acyltransferase [Methylobacter sp.]
MLRKLFYLFISKPLALVILGINARGREHLPLQGPAIIVANHNSHLDALALMSLFPLAVIDKVHPVAAADYFLRNRIIKWFALNVIGIIPLERKATEKGADVLAPVFDALDKKAILILFPEGSRGEPESLSRFKNGIAHLALECPEVPVIPMFFYGLGKALPKGEFILVPFFVDVFIGAPMRWEGSRSEFMRQLNQKMLALQEQANITDASDL